MLVWFQEPVVLKAASEGWRFCPSGLLALDGVGNLRGWQWLFIVEGVPTVLMGIYTFCLLAETPATVNILFLLLLTVRYLCAGLSSILLCRALESAVPLCLDSCLDLLGIS